MGQVNLGTASGRIVVDGSGARSGFATAQAAAQAFFDVIADRVSELEQIGDRLTKIGAVAAGGFGLAINSAAGFEQRLSAIEAVSGATEEQMAAISKTALRLGADTKFSAGEAAQAIEELVKAGVSVDDAINGAADATVNLAAAGEIELPRAAEIASNAMNVFNLNAAEMPKVADLIAGAANASAIDVEQFAQSLQASGAAANLAGFKFDDLSQAIALMGNAGIKGSDAGTSLKTMLLNLNPVTEKQKGLMEDLGLITKDGSNQFFDAAGNVKSFADVAQVLQDSLQGMTKQQKLATLETLFGSDAIRAAAVVSEAGAKGFNDMATAMGKVTAADVARTRMDNLRGALEELKGSLETAAIIVGRYFLPALTAIVRFVTRVINVFANAPEGVQKFFTVVLALGGGLSLLMGVMIKLLFILGPLLAKFLGLLALRQVFSIFTVGFAALRSGAGIVAALTLAGSRAVTVFSRFGKIAKVLFGVLRSLPGVLTALRVAVAFAFGPWGALIAGIIAAVIFLYKRFQPFHDLVIRVGQALRGIFFRAVDLATQALNALKLGFQGFAGSEGGIIGFFVQIGAAARVLWDALKQVGAAFMQNVVPALKAAGGQIWAALKDAWAQLSVVVMTQLWPALQQLWVAFQPILPILRQVGAAVLKAIGAFLLFQAAVGAGALLGLIKFAQVIVTYVLPAVIKFAAFMITVLITVFGAVARAVVTLVTAIVTFAAAFLRALQTAWNIASTVVTAIIGFFVRLVSAIVGFVTAVAAKWRAFWMQFAPIVRAAWSLITAIFELGVAVIKLIFVSLFVAIRAIFRAGWAAISAIARAAWTGITAVVRGAINVLRSVVRAGVNFVRNVIVAVWRRITGDTNATWSTVAAAVSSRVNRVRAVVARVVAAVRAAVSAAWNFVKSNTQAAWSAFASTISRFVNRAMTIVRSIKGKVTSALSGAASWLISAGRSVVQGFIDGVSSMLGAAAAKVRELAGLAREAAAAALKIGSPSKVFEDLGRFTVEGYIVGVDKMINPLEAVMDEVLVSTIPVTPFTGTDPSPIPKVIIPKPDPPVFPSRLTLRVGNREFDAYVQQQADVVIGQAADLLTRGRK